MDLGIFLLGWLVGILVGLTGIGGGSVMTPALILAGVQPAVAVGSDLVYAAITKGVGAVAHLRQGTVNLPLVFYLGVGSVPAGLMGARLFADLERGLGPAMHVWVTRMVAILLILVSAVTLFDVVRPRTCSSQKPPLAWTGRLKVWTVLLGAFVGLVVSFTSIGGGSIVAALLVYLYRLPASEVVGSDIVQAVFLTGAAGLGHAAAGWVDPRLVVSLLLGSIPGVLLGSALCPRMPLRALRGVVATAILVAGIKLL